MNEPHKLEEHLVECAKCKLSKPASDFNRNRTTPNGLQTYCKTCARVYEKTRTLRRREKRERERILKHGKPCTICGKQKPAHHFAVDNSTKTGLRGQCRQCQADLKAGRRAPLRQRASKYGPTGATAPPPTPTELDETKRNTQSQTDLLLIDNITSPHRDTTNEKVYRAILTVPHPQVIEVTIIAPSMDAAISTIRDSYPQLSITGIMEDGG